MSVTLYDLTSEFESLQAAIVDGELSPELEMALDLLTEETLPQKIDGYCKVLAQLDGEADMLKAEVDRLSERITTRVNAAKRLKENLLNAFQRIGFQKFKTPLFSLWVQANPPSVEVDEPANLPEQYRRVTIAADKAALARDWKAGQELPAGVTVHKGFHLRVK